eukprot:GFUD01007865.1.p1 GENE.GFUD01007865.1~~GFUD01007865.1.p1  ORF type:complete len:1241 (-),score=282.81 GFUD01007865.1:403-4125(-)
MEGGGDHEGMGFGPGARNRLEEQQFLGLQLHVLPEELDDFDMLVNLPAGFRARIGLNETTLTRALARGDFAMAEKIIEEATDIEFLNDGALSATPLNMVLTGRSSFFHQSRNLKLAHILLQRGANPNLRIPNHDMESASESPLELLLRYYLKLIEVFGVPGSGQCRTSYRPNSFEETELMDTVGINGEIGGLGPGQITSQARQLLVYCLENGGDTNLPTTDAAKTIYHMAVVAPVTDPALIQRMLELGANVNHADVHNTTPLMDIIMLGDEQRALSDLASLQSAGRSLLLDSQNCSLQSALWRTIFQGHCTLALELLAANANQSCSARVEPLSRPAVRIPRHPTIKSAVPGLLAPFLNDSPCTANLNVRLPKKRAGRSTQEYSALASVHLGRNTVAPLVDRGFLQGQPIADLTSTLIRLNTDHTQAGDSSVVDSGAIIPLMFGEVSAGLRQLAVRTILRHSLFSCSQEETLTRLDKVCEKSGFMLTQLLVRPSLAKLAQQEETMMAHEYEIELGSEMELSLGLDPLENMDAVELGISEIAISENPFSTADELSVSDIIENSEVNGLDDVSDVPGDLLNDLIENLEPADNKGERVIDIFETIDKLDRELEVIRTDSVLQTLDRDLATWEVELQGTLDRIQRYQAELSNGDLIRDVRLIRRGRNRGIEEARRRSEQLMEELRVQRSILVKSDRDIEEAEEAVGDLLEQAGEVGSILGEGEYLVPNICQDTDSSSDGVVEVRRNGASFDSLYWENRRRRIDENWSLGADRVLAGETGDELEYSESDVVPADGRSLDEILSNVCPMCLDVYLLPPHDCPMLRPSVVQPMSYTQSSPDNSTSRPTLVHASPEHHHHTEQLVQTLSVSVSVSGAAPHLPPLTDSVDSELSSDTESNSWLSNSSSSQRPGPGPVASTSPQTMANNLAILNERLFQQRRRIGAAAISLVDQVLTPPPPLTPSPPPLRDPFTLRMPGYFRSTPPSFRSPPVPPMRHIPSPLLSAAPIRHSPPANSSVRMPGLVASSDSEPDSDNSSDTDTWGGTFSLRHTRRQAEQAEPPTNDATVVSRLTSRTLYALTDSLGIPHSLRPCFAVEAARLQLTLALFNHQSISCDRNCEGDESDSDSEEDWLATDTDTEEETAEEVEQPPLTDSEDSTESSVSDFSQRSWFGSQAELTEARRLSPRSTFSPPLSSSPRSITSDSETSISSRDHAWLPDREDLRRVRHFLSSSPGPEFNHSTDSESESSGI